MAAILRKGGPTLANVKEYKPGLSSAAMARHRAQLKIDAENKMLAERLRSGVRPEIDHRVQAAEYAKTTAVRANISNAAKRADRAAKARARRARVANEALSNSAPAGLLTSGGAMGTMSGSGAGGGGSSGALVALGGLRSATGVATLRTASDVRAQVAKGRGDELPDWLTSSRSKPPPPQGSKPSGGGAAAGGLGNSWTRAEGPPKPTFLLTHTGSMPVLEMPPFPMG